MLIVLVEAQAHLARLRWLAGPCEPGCRPLGVPGGLRARARSFGHTRGAEAQPTALRVSEYRNGSHGLGMVLGQGWWR